MLHSKFALDLDCSLSEVPAAEDLSFTSSFEAAIMFFDAMLFDAMFIDAMFSGRYVMYRHILCPIPYIQYPTQIQG